MTSSSKRSPRLTGRRVPDKPKRFEIRVYAEGEKTEELYLTHWNRKHRNVNVVIARHEKTTPMGLVTAAIHEMKEDRRRSKRYGKAFDEYWCVFDEDEHPKLIEALHLAAAKGIKVAFSGPCLELWFLLHYQDQSANLHRRVAQRLAYELMGCYGKRCLTQTEVEMLDPHYACAMNRAIVLNKKHALDGTEPPWNPYSNIFELTETISKGGGIDGSGKPHKTD